MNWHALAKTLNITTRDTPGVSGRETWVSDEGFSDAGCHQGHSATPRLPTALPVSQIPCMGADILGTTAVAENALKK